MKHIPLILFVLAASAYAQQPGPFRPSQGTAQTVPKGPLYHPSGAAVINAAGQVDAAVGTPTNCVYVNGTNGPCVTGAGGGTVTQFNLTSMPWLTLTNPTSTPTIAPTTGQSSHQVIGTCGSATAFQPCTLVLADLPVGTAAAATLVTSVGNPGSDSNVATEKAVRAAITAGGGGGGSQTPWIGNIDAAGFSLSNVQAITINTNFTGQSNGYSGITQNLTFPGTRGTNTFAGFRCNIADPLVDGSACISVANTNTSDNVFLDVIGAASGATSPTGIGIKLNGNGLLQNNPLFGGTGIYIKNFGTAASTTTGIIVENSLGGNDTLMSHLNRGDGTAYDYFQAGSTADQERGFGFGNHLGATQWLWRINGINQWQIIDYPRSGVVIQATQGTPGVKVEHLQLADVTGATQGLQIDPLGNVSGTGLPPGGGGGGGTLPTVTGCATTYNAGTHTYTIPSTCTVNGIPAPINCGFTWNSGSGNIFGGFTTPDGATTPTFQFWTNTTGTSLTGCNVNTGTAAMPNSAIKLFQTVATGGTAPPAPTDYSGFTYPMIHCAGAACTETTAADGQSKRFTITPRWSSVPTATVTPPYTALTTDVFGLIKCGSSGTITFPQAGSGGNWLAGQWAVVRAETGATCAVAATTSTIGPSSLLSIAADNSVMVLSDGTNYQVIGTSSAGGGGGGSGADALGAYVVTASAHPNANDVNLGAGSTGLVLSTVTAGVAALTTKPVVTSVGNPGSDSNIPTEKAVNTAIAAASAAGSSQTFTSSGTLTCPASGRVFWQITAAGAGGSGGMTGFIGGGHGGAGGATVERWCTCTPTASVSVTVGTGGTAGSAGSPGTVGGNGGNSIVASCGTAQGGSYGNAGTGYASYPGHDNGAPDTNYYFGQGSPGTASFIDWTFATSDGTRQRGTIYNPLFDDLGGIGAGPQNSSGAAGFPGGNTRHGGPGGGGGANGSSGNWAGGAAGTSVYFGAGGGAGGAISSGVKQACTAATKPGEGGSGGAGDGTAGLAGCAGFRGQVTAWW